MAFLSIQRGSLSGLSVNSLLGCGSTEPIFGSLAKLGMPGLLATLHALDFCADAMRMLEPIPEREALLNVTDIFTAIKWLLRELLLKRYASVAEVAKFFTFVFTEVDNLFKRFRAGDVPMRPRLTNALLVEHHAIATRLSRVKVFTCVLQSLAYEKSTMPGQ